MKLTRLFIDRGTIGVGRKHRVFFCLAATSLSMCSLWAEEWVHFKQSGYTWIHWYNSSLTHAPDKNWTVWCCYEQDDGWSIGKGICKLKESIVTTAWFGAWYDTEPPLKPEDWNVRASDWIDLSLMGNQPSSSYYANYIYTMPSNYNGKDIVRIEEEAFRGSSYSGQDLPAGPEYFSLPGTIKEIGEYAFAYNDRIIWLSLVNTKVQKIPERMCYSSNLLYVGLPAGLVEIGDEAFLGCDFYDVDLPDTLIRVGKGAFRGCGGNGTRDITVRTESIIKGDGVLRIPDGVVYIGDFAFSGVSWNVDVEMPKSMSRIGDSVFYNSSIKRVNWNVAEAEIGTNAFAKSQIRQLSGPGVIKKIEPFGFQDCTLLNSVVGISGSIGASAFSGCTALTEVTLRSGVKSIGKDAFLGCPLSAVHVDSGDKDRIKSLLKSSGCDVSKITFVGPIYAIEFDANGGSCAEAHRTIEHGEAYGELPTASRDKYFFEGWFTQPEGGVRVSTSTAAVQGAILYAHWTRGCYITFDAAGGECAVAGQTYKKGASSSDLPVPTRAQYNFTGWFDEGGNKITTPFVVPDCDEVKFTARWGGVQYTATLDANGGTCAQKTAPVYYNRLYGEGLPVATRAGYRFLGWFMEKDGNRNANNVTVTGDATLYAHWSTSLQLVFNANGGTSSAQSRFVEKGKAYGELPSASREGYDFAGWFTAASGGTKVSATTTIKLDGETIYAQWKAHRYSIKLDTNGAEGSLDGLMLSYGVEIDLPASGLTRAGYAFAGWALSATGSVVYPVGKKVGNVTPVDGETVTLYAVWIPVPLTVSYARQHYPWNGLADVTVKVEGDAGVNYQVAFQIADADGVVKSVEAVHAVGQTQIQRVWTLVNGAYAFVWNAANDLAADYKSSGLKMRAVAYDKNAQEVSHSDWVSMGTVNLGDVAGRVAGKQPLAYGADWVSSGAKSVIKANGTVIAELTGKGVFEWMGEAGQTYTLTLEILNSSGARVGEVYSVTWEWVTRSTLTFVGNIDGVGMQTRVYDDTYAYGEFPHVEKSCYDFLGWFTSATGGDRVRETDISDVSKTLYGHWQASGYQIVFDANGGTGEMSSQVIRTGVKTALAGCTYGVSDSACIGWSLSPDGPVQFKNGEEVLDLVPITKDLKLYAVWALENVELKSFRQRYPWNGLVDIDFELTGVAGRNYTLLVQARDNVGGTNLNVCTVLDEKLEARGNPLVVPAGTHRIMWNADADLPDGFKCDDVSMRLAFVTTVEFDACGGQCDVTAKQYVLGDSYGELPMPTKAGAAFRGWYGDSEYSEAVTVESLTVPSVTILYAKWEAEK